MKSLYSREQFPDLEKIRKCKQSLRPKATEEDLTKILRKSTKDLYNFLLSQFKERYEKENSFKKEINIWAINVKLDINQNLIKNLCKEGAYSLINRVLLYRIYEDKKSEHPEITETSLRKWRLMVERPSKKLEELFKLKAKQFFQFYNSPLFNSITYDKIDWNENIILKILARFSNIDFKKVNNDIIGKAYERHIPETERKELGQFYTPEFIVDYLVDKLKLKSESKVLDPACGSGAFLTKVTCEISKKNTDLNSIIENNIYGIDINPFATQLTTMNILLQTIGNNASPKKINIITADTLLDKKISNENLFPTECSTEANKNIQTLNSFLDKDNGKFDAIIGNPPYRCFGLRSNKALKNVYHQYLKSRWKNSAEYKISYYPLFIESSIDLLKQGGVLAFILPDSFLVGMYFSKIRKYILDTCKILEIVYCREDFWEGLSVGCPTMIVLKKEKNIKKRNDNKLTVKLANHANDIKSRSFIENTYPQDTFNKLTKNRFELYFDQASYELVNNMRKNTRLKFRDVIKGHTGIRAKKNGKEGLKSNRKTNSYYSKGLHKGSELKSYKIKYLGGWIKLHKDFLCSGGWDSSIIERPKIMLRQTGDSLIAALDKNHYYHFNHIHSISSVDEDVYLEWICLLLNSDLLNRFYHIISMELGRANAQIDIDQIHDLPYVQPSAEIESRLHELYLSLSQHSPNQSIYQNAQDELEEIVAKAYGINKKSSKNARKMVKEKKLAMVKEKKINTAA